MYKNQRRIKELTSENKFESVEIGEILMPPAF